MRKVFVSFILVIFIFAMLPRAATCNPALVESASWFDPLKESLIADGFDKELIEKLYTIPPSGGPEVF